MITSLSYQAVGAAVPVFAAAPQITLTFNSAFKNALKVIGAIVIIAMVAIAIMKVFPKIGRGGGTAQRVGWGAIVVGCLLGAVLFVPEQTIVLINWVLKGLDGAIQSFKGGKIG